MSDSNIDLLLLISGLFLLFLTCCLSFLASFVFSKEVFKKRKIFKYISISSALDGFQSLIGILSSIVFYINIKIPLDSFMAYNFRFVEYYLIICFGSILKTLSDYLNVSVAFYRLFELSKYHHLNKRFKVSHVITCLVILSIFTNIPLFTWKKLVQDRNRTDYEMQENIIFVDGYNFTSITWYIRLGINLINLLLILIPNVYFISVLKDHYKNRSHLNCLSLKQAQQLIKDNTQISSERTLKGFARPINNSSKEICMSLLVGSLSLVFTLDFIFKTFFYFINFKQLSDLIFVKKYAHIISSFFNCFIHLTNIFCLFCFNYDFRKSFRNLFNLK
jgi:hypothetical protein